MAGRAIDVLRAASETRHEPVVILDLVQVRSIDAAGLGFLVELHHSLASAGRQLRVSRVSSRVKRTIRMVKLHQLLDLPDGQAAAA